MSTLGLAVAWRFLRARGASEVVAHEGEQAAARGEPFPPGMHRRPEDSGRPTEELPVPVAAVGVDRQQSMPAIPVAIVGGALPGAATGPPTQDQVETAVRKRGLRIRGRHYGLKIVFATLGIMLLALVAAAFLAVKLLMGGGTSEDTSLEDFATFEAEAGSATTTTSAPGVLPADAAAGDVAAGDAAAAAGGEEAAPGAATVVVLRPADGTYTYAGSGQYETKVLGLSERKSMPSSMQAVVSPNSTCFNLELTLVPADKIETQVLCPGDDGSLHQPGEKRHQKQLGLSLDSTITCKPQRPWVQPGMTAGQRWASECSIANKGAINSSATLNGTVTFVGVENVTVGGEAVPGYHMRLDEESAGADVKGPVTVDNWYATSNGLLLKTVRRHRLTGFATYNEDSTFTLSSLTPG